MPLKKPYFMYNSVFAFLRPNVGLEIPEIKTKGVERHDHIAASGKKHSYLVGSRNTIAATFGWQDNTARDNFITMWDVVKGGAVFEYSEDEAETICGDGTLCGAAGAVCGDAASGGGTQVRTNVTVENTEMTIEPEEVDGYWRISFLMREAV